MNPSTHSSFYLRLQALEALQTAWRSRYRNRARGGSSAMSGFHFQFLVVLHDSVVAWLHAPPNERTTPTVFTELLSDAVDWNMSNFVIITQIKRRQTARNLSEALDELWDLHTLAQTTISDFAAELRYRVASAKSDVQDVRKAILRWAPTGPSEASVITAFRDRTEVVVLNDVEGDLLSLLANELRVENPLACVHLWLGRLLAAASDNSFQRAATEIWSELHAAASRSDRSIPQSIYVWSSRDRMPESIETGDYLTGERPHPRHLREGYFAPRVRLLKWLTDELESWIDPHPAKADRALRLPVFWIGGRSGTGKSTALLQVLANLHVDGFGPILWLGSKVASLPAAIKWSTTLRTYNQPIIIGIDDPYAPLTHTDADRVWREAVAELEAIRQGDDPSEVPIVICSGPTEQAEQFENDFRDDVRIRLSELPHETREDLEDLRAWFRSRTSRTPPEVGDDNILLVQLFFEWRVGAPLFEFSQRFQRRIRNSIGGASLVEHFARVLAMNRLYVGYPKVALEKHLDPEQSVIFDRLRRDHHIEESADDDRPGLWLAHPHLANAIYEAWYPTGSSKALRKAHLRASVIQCVTFGANPSQQMAPLWALAGSLDPVGADSTIVARLAGDDIPLLLRELYGEISFMYSLTLPVSHLPSWIEVDARLDAPGLIPSPVAVALSVLRPENLKEVGLRLTCHKLLQHRESFSAHVQREIVESVIALLQSSSEWREWQAVMCDAIRRTPDSRLWPMVTTWVRARMPWYRPPTVLRLAMEAAPDSNDLQELVQDLLTAAGSDVAWGDLAQALLESSSSRTIRGAVAEWAERHQREFGARFLLGKLVNAEYLPATAWAEQWASQWRLERTANFVLEPLSESVNPSPRTLSWCLEWVRASHPGAGKLIKRLFELGRGDAELSAEVLRWLEMTPFTDGSWSYAWEAVWTAATGDPDLERWGRAWLEGVELRERAWTFVWQPLWKFAPGDDRLAALGRQWLCGTSLSHGSWAYVWEALWRVYPGDDELESLGRRWVGMLSSDQGSWGRVWEQLRKSAADDGELFNLARRWLETVPPNHASWVHVWQTLIKGASFDRKLILMGHRWLVGVPSNHGSWGYVWSALWKSREDDNPGELAGDIEGLRQLGRRWLSTAGADHAGWGYVWNSLWEFTPGDEELAALGHQWLTVAPADHGSWGYVWGPLWRGAEGNEELTNLGLGWLGITPADHGSWGYVCEALVQRAAADLQVAGIVRAWLANAVADHRAWGYVWDVLWRLTPNDVPLATQGRQWLGTASADHVSWGYVWGPLWKIAEGDEQLTALGFQWLAEAPYDHGSWSYVWDALIKNAPQSQQLLRIGRHWLATVPANHGAWGYVWGPLWKDAEGDDELANLGLHWLADTSADHGSWGYVWEQLWAFGQGDIRLAALGRQWLATAPVIHGSWAYVWEKLWERTVGEGQLDALGRQWLAVTSSDHGSWEYVWTPLWNAAPGDDELAELARKWLTTAHIDHGAWGYVWERLWEVTPGDQKLASFGCEWLAAVSVNHGSWGHVWCLLWKSAPGNLQLVALGRQWLAAAFGHGAWEYVWTPLWNFTPRDPDLARLAHEWLTSAATDHGSWGHVWEGLWKRAPGSNELSLLGRSWLETAPVAHGSWQYVWSNLWSANVGEESLLRLARHWLETVPAEHGSWSYVWDEVWKAGENTDDLFLLALDWLQRCPAGHHSWVPVWRTLSRKQPSDKRLNSIARQWLAQPSLDHRDWLYVWRHASLGIRPDAELNRLAVGWLASHGPNHPSHRLVEDVIRTQSFEAFDSGTWSIENLLSLSYDAPKWVQMWIELWESGNSTDELIILGTAWLRSSFPNRLWASVFLRLWGCDAQRSVLKELGSRWLIDFRYARRAHEVARLLETPDPLRESSA